MKRIQYRHTEITNLGSAIRQVSKCICPES